MTCVVPYIKLWRGWWAVTVEVAAKTGVSFVHFEAECGAEVEATLILEAAAGPLKRVLCQIGGKRQSNA